MKKRLLTLLSVACATMGVFAQIQAPKPTSFLELENLKGADVSELDPPQAPDSVYIYNVEGNAFLCGSNAWGTQTSILPEGLLYVVTYDETAGGYSLKTSSGEKAGKYLFRDNEAGCFIDMGTQGHEYWNITKNGQYYRIRSAANDDKWGADTYDNYETTFFGWSGASTIIDANIPADKEGAGLDWAFVSQEEYNSWKAKWDAVKPALDASALLATALKNAAECAGLDTAAETAVYKNADSSADELNAAAESVNQKINDWKKAQASVDNPQDMTSSIVNPNFDGIKFDGWKGSSFGAGGATDECGERFNMDYDTWQVIEGLPAGIYRVNVNAFYRAGSIANDWNTKDDPSYRHAKLYAVSGEDSLNVNIRSLSSVSTDRTDLGGAVIGENYYAPNSMQDFVRFENAGIDMDNTIMLPVMDGKLKIGVVKKDNSQTDNWTITDTWRLTYYGGALDAYKMWSEDVIATIAGDLQDFITEDTYYCRAEIANFQAALQAAREATTPEEIHKNTMAMTEVTQRALASINSYNAYKALVDKYVEGINSGEYDYNGDLWDEFVDLVLAEEENTLKPGELTGEEIAAKAVELEDMFEAAVKASINEGDDCTDMLKNPSFAEGFNYWTNSKGATPVGNQNCGLDICKNVEVYDNVVDVQQVVEGVPDGIYALTCQAFERPAGNGSFDGTEASKVFLFMNDFKTPVQNICKDAMPEDQAEDKVNCYITEETGAWPYDYNVEGYGWVPNSVDGASYAFAAERYYQTVYGLVEGGKMTIGLTSNGQKAHWVLWAKFKLVYEGKSAKAVSNVLSVVLPGIEEYYDANKDENLTDPAASALANAIAEAQDAMNGTDGDAMYQALIDLNAAYAAAQENAKVVAGIEPVYTKLGGDANNKCEEMSDDALLDECNKYYNDIEDQKYLELTTEELSAYIDEINAFIEKVDKAYTTWQQEDKYTRIAEAVAGADDKDPAELTEFLVNPDMSDGTANGWTLDLTTYTNKGYQANSAYTGAETELNGAPYTPECNQFIEVWRSGNSPILGNIYQEILLPAGTYKLGADIIATWQGGSKQDTKDCFLFAGGSHMEVATGNGAPEHFELVFKVAEDKTLVRLGINCSETTTANWLAADNFTLTAYGTNSALGENGTVDAINGIATEAARNIYTITGVRVSNLNKAGLYIINGKKVLVK